MRKSIALFLRYLANERNSSELTIKAYREDLFGLVDWFEAVRGDLPSVDSVSPQELRSYQSALQEAGYARTTISRKLASLRSFYKFAMRQGIASTNPAKPLRNPRQQRKLPLVLTGDEIGKLLETPSGSTVMGLRDRAILETMYSSGLRVSELVGLQDGDIDRHEQIVRIRGKGRKERVGPLGSFAIKAIDASARVESLTSMLERSRLVVKLTDATVMFDAVTAPALSRSMEDRTVRSVASPFRRLNPLN